MNMYCNNCGCETADGASFCKNCGAALKTGAPGASASGIPEAPDMCGVGFSPRISDPAFIKYRKNSNAWSLIFSLILAAAAIVGFPIYGNASGELDWPQSLYYGLGIGGMFVAIALIQTLKRGADRTWDGTVEHKDSYRVRDIDNGRLSGWNTVYVLKIRKDTGGLKKHKWRDIPGPFHYYNVGDRVRHHKGLYYYEKYDKSRDTLIMCAACLSFHDIGEDVCPKCGCPLLK